MADLLTLSTDVIDGRIELAQAGPLNRITHEFSELNARVGMVEAFSHSIVFRTDAGLVAFDTSNEHGGERCVNAIRQWDKAPFHSIIFTHGHIDHVGGCGAFIDDNHATQVVAHENVARRFERYRLTNGYNHVINERQFGQFRRRGYDLAGQAQFLPTSTPEPDITYSHRHSLKVGDTHFELHHAKGETDDHTWAWIPSERAICAGDFFIWAFPMRVIPKKPNATQGSGPLHCERWPPWTPSSSYPHTVSPLPVKSEFNRCSMTWPTHSSHWFSKHWR